MKYTDKFEKLVEECITHNQYVGLGNPNAKILLVGKEAGFNPDNKDKDKDYKQNALVWKSGNPIYSEPYEADDSIKNYRHTWQKYQLLHDIIFEQERPKEYAINFVQNIFATELSNLPYPNTTNAKKQENFSKNLLERKKVFWNSKYISQFPIVIIAALDEKYITNHGKGETREIDNIFDVEFIKEEEFNKNNKYWIHNSKNTENPKLVIHTRQFTNGAFNDLLKMIGEEVKTFAKENSIDLYPNKL